MLHATAGGVHLHRLAVSVAEFIQLVAKPLSQPCNPSAFAGKFFIGEIDGHKLPLILGVQIYLLHYNINSGLKLAASSAFYCAIGANKKRLIAADATPH